MHGRRLAENGARIHTLHEVLAWCTTDVISVHHAVRGVCAMDHAGNVITLAYVVLNVWRCHGTSTQDEHNVTKPHVLHIAALLPMTGQKYPAGQSALTAANMALTDVNKREDILAGFTLKIHVKDTMVITVLIVIRVY